MLIAAKMGTMSRDTRTRLGLASALLLVSACGRINIEQLPRPQGPGRDAGQPLDPEDAGEGDEPDDPSDADMAEVDASDEDAALPDAEVELDGAVDASEEDAAPPDAAVDAGPVCSLTGTWAAQMDVQLSWPAALVAAGSGTLRVWGRAQVTQNGNALSVGLLPCHVQVPDFALNPLFGQNESYGITFATAPFDRSPSPFATSDTTGTVAGALPGGTVTLSGLSMLVGLTMANPLTDGWPAVGAVMQADHDNNGKPAVSANYKTGGAYRNPPLNMTLSARSDIAYIAARLAFTSSANVTSCDALNGSATVSAFDTHIVGCRVAGGTTDCSTAQRDFIDGSRPSYGAGSAVMRLERVADNATCAAVRSALP